MNFSQLLSLLRDDYLHDRSSQAPGSPNSDYLWSDDTLMTYLNEAQRRFAVDTRCIRDGTSPDITCFQLVAYQEMYELHHSVIAVISVRGSGDKVDWARAGHAAFDTYLEPDNYYFNPATASRLPPGKVVAYDTDEYVMENAEGSMEVMTLRVYPKPSPQYIQNVRMRVVRKPVRWFTSKTLNMAPEIPTDHHLDILNYAAYLALRKADHDAEDIGRSDKFLQAYQISVERAKNLLKMKEYQEPMFSFGRNGFSWEGN